MSAEEIVINGVKVSSAGAAAFAPDITITLPFSGRKAEIDSKRRDKVRDLEKYAQMAGDVGSAFKLAAAKIAVRARIDGRMLTFEDAMELDADDFNAIVATMPDQKKTLDSPSSDSSSGALA